jgi:hypothetical protein
MADTVRALNTRLGTVTITTPAANGTTTEVNMNGLVRWLDFTTGAMEDTDSTNFILENEYGGTVFASGTLDESVVSSFGSVFPVRGTTTVVAVGEGTQGASVDHVYSITYDEST